MSRGSMPPSASRTTRRPETSPAATSTRPRAASLPSRRDHSRRRRGLERPLHPGTTGVTSAGFRGCRSVDRRGVVPSPALRPKGEERIRRHAGRTQRGQRVSTTSTSGGCASKYATKGGLSLSRANATPRAAPPRTNDSPESGRSRAWPGTPGQPAMTAERAPLPARMTRGDRPGRPALPPRRGGRPDGGAPGSRSPMPYGPATAPSGLARGLRSNCPPRLEAPCVPVAALLDPGSPPFRMSRLKWYRLLGNAFMSMTNQPVLRFR